MEPTAESSTCECGCPEKLAADPDSSIRFDARMNEYHVMRPSGGYSIMRYCFWCGGRLPESTRGSLFTTPSQLEMEEISELLAEARTTEDALRILGPPDETFDGGGSVVRDGRVLIRWQRSFRCTSRWNTLVLSVHDTEDCKRHCSISGQFIGDPADGEQTNSASTC